MYKTVSETEKNH